MSGRFMLGEAAQAARRALAADCERWTQRVGGFTAVPAIIRHLGANPASIFADVGLAPDALDSPDRRIPYPAMGALFKEAASRTGCAHFGLLCGRTWHLSDLGVVGDLVRHSATFGSALQTLTVHQHLNSEGGLAFVLQRGNVVDLGYAIYHPHVVGRNHIYDGIMAAGCNYMRDLCGAGWTPSEVHFPHARPSDVDPHRHFYRAPLRYDAEFCALRFSAHWLGHAVRDADPAKHEIAEEKAAAGGRGDLLQQVYRALRILLLRGQISGNDVAEMLTMHRRTLNRRLEAQGVTFQNVLDRVRFQVACELLEDTRVTIDDVAAALGYAGVSPFMRSFRRWSGTTPARWRRTAEKGLALAR